MGERLTYTAAAAMLGRSVPFVKARCQDKTLETIEASGRQWVDRASVERLRASGDKRRAVRQGVMS